MSSAMMSTTLGRCAPIESVSAVASMATITAKESDVLVIMGDSRLAIELVLISALR